MSAYLDWHVGMKVVCVDATFRRLGSSVRRGPEIMPEVGRIYTLREIGYLYPSPWNTHLCVRLNEIVNQPMHYDLAVEAYESAFGVDRFRPVQKRKTDISIFERLLTPSDDDTFRELEAEVFDYEPTEVPFR